MYCEPTPSCDWSTAPNTCEGEIWTHAGRWLCDKHHEELLESHVEIAKTRLQQFRDWLARRRSRRHE